MATIRPLFLRVPASTSNIGTGFDSFGIALNLNLDVRFIPGKKTELERFNAIKESNLRLGQDPIIRGMRRAGTLAGQPLPKGKIQVEGNFPPGRGLGASGAGISAGLILGNKILGNPLSNENLLNEAIALEGNPENAVAAFKGGAHWSVPIKKNSYIHLPINIHRNLRFILIIPPYQLETKRSRQALPASVSLNRATRQAQRPPILLEGLSKLNPDFIKVGIEDELHVAQRLKLLRGARNLITFAYQAGALGATISGAGSALLIITRTGEVRNLETLLNKRVKRLWGNEGTIITTSSCHKGASFLRFSPKS